MNQPKRSLRIAVADDERDMRQFFQELLPPLGHEVVAVAENGRDLVQQCGAKDPDLVIADIKMPDMDGIEAAAQVNRQKPVPIILVSAHHDTELLARAGTDAVMAYLVKPVKPADLESAIALAVMRFEHFRELSQEAANLRQALEDRKVVERAKGVVMRRLRVDEPDAFRRLRKMAADQNRKLIEVAQEILTVDESFRALEKS
jgi:two-component system, response regulator PdtaR